jgi:hypothetical protein
MSTLAYKAKLVLLMVVILAVGLLVYAVASDSQATSIRGNTTRFVILLVLASIAARMRVKLPGTDSNISMNLPFILTATLELGVTQAIIVGMVSTAVQCLPASGPQFKPVKMAFNLCNLCNAVALASLAASGAMHIQSIATKPLFIVTAALVFFLADTIPVAAILAATENGRMWSLWRKISGLTVPYFVLSAGIATIVVTAGYYRGLVWLLALFVMYSVYSSFKRYFHQTAPHTVPHSAPQAQFVSAARG